MSAAKPFHGETRNHHSETSGSSPTEFRDATTGEVVFKGFGVTLTQSVSEKWCEGCQKWITTKGVIGPIMWDAEHASHKERPS